VVVTVVPFNAFYTPANYWFYFPFLIWGIIVVNQGLITFTNGGLFGKAWEERKIKKFMEK